MENTNNEKFNKESESENKKLLKEAISGLGDYLEDFKKKTSSYFGEEDGKMDKLKDKSIQLKDETMKKIKKTYNEASPLNQKIIIATIFAVIASIVTAILMKTPCCRHKNDEIKWD